MAVNTPRTLRIKVTLRDIKPPIWRRILVPESASLHDLHTTLQIAMGWLDCHLYSFDVRGRRFLDPDSLDDPWGEWADARATPLARLRLKERSRLRYTYDFGDDWEHTLLVEEVIRGQADEVLPLCIKGKRACPPEDCGSTPGYQRVLDALRNPAQADPEFIEWIPEDYDPENFDLERVNDDLRVAFQGRGELRLL